MPVIIQMVQHTRLDCVTGTAGILRAALSEALHHARHRRAFGAPLVDQPLMRSVLADLVLESEAATALALRLARAFDHPDDPHESLLRRVLTPAAKYWVCKRGPQFTAEAMEVLGGNGYIEDSGLPRLYREAPVNSIWEGFGNVMCLDVLRALARAPEAFDALLAETAEAVGAEPLIAAALDRVRHELATGPTAEARARAITGEIVIAVQAALLVRHAPSFVAEAFCSSRLNGLGGAFGALPTSVDTSAIIQRANWEPAM